MEPAPGRANQNAPRGFFVDQAFSILDLPFWESNVVMIHFGALVEEGCKWTAQSAILNSVSSLYIFHHPLNYIPSSQRNIHTHNPPISMLMTSTRDVEAQKLRYADELAAYTRRQWDMARQSLEVNGDQRTGKSSLPNGRASPSNGSRDSSRSRTSQGQSLH